MYCSVVRLGIICAIAGASAQVAAALPRAPLLAEIPLYDAIDLGVLTGDTTSRATGINFAGQVVGVSTSSSGTEHAFLWSDGRMIGLGDLGGGSSQAFALNNGAQVVGTSINAQGQEHGFRWTPADTGNTGTMEDLGTTPGNVASRALGINSAGMIVGDVALPGIRRPAIYSNGAWMPLEIPSSPMAGGSAWGINEANQVVGAAVTSSGKAHAFIYSPGTGVQDITPDASGESVARAVNEAGEVVGQIGMGANTQAFLWEPPQVFRPRPQLLLLALETPAAVYDINTPGWAAGELPPLKPGGRTRAALKSSEGGMGDLNARIPAGTGWELTTAAGVNDRGWVVGSGIHNGQHHAFLLAPTAALTGFMVGANKSPSQTEVTISGNKPVFGNLTLSQAAPGTGTRILFSSTDRRVVPVPKPMIIRPGAVTLAKPFRIVHRKVRQRTRVNLLAAGPEGHSQTVILTLLP